MTDASDAEPHLHTIPPQQARQGEKLFFERFGVVVLWAMAVSMPLLFHGVNGALTHTSNNPRQWLPVGLGDAQIYEWFLDCFGRDEIAVVSWPGCTLDDSRVERLASALVADGPQRYFERALTGTELLRELTSPPMSLPRGEALRRLQGNVVGADGATTCLILVVSPAGEADRKGAVRHIYDVAKRTCRLSADELRLGGPTVDAATLDAESQRLLYRLAALCAVIVFLSAWQQMKQLRVAVIILVGALYNTGLTLSIVHWTGGRMNLTMINLVPLVFVLSVSMAIHLVNYYLGALREGRRGAAERAVAQGWPPCVLAAATTAIGFCSLVVSTIGPVRDFGAYSAAGMIVTAATSILYLPSALRYCPLLEAAAVPRSPAGNGKRARVSLGLSAAVTVNRMRPWIATGFVAVMAVLAVGLIRLEATVKLQNRFSRDSRFVSDANWIEQNVAPLVPLEVVVRFRQPESRRLFERMEIVDTIQRELAQRDHVGATMSAVSLAPPLPERRNVGAAMRARVQERRLMKHRDRFVEAHYLADAAGEELWRITVRLRAASDIDYGIYIEQLRSELDPMIDAKWGDDVSAAYTGAIPLVYKAQRRLLADLGRSFLGAFLAIAVVMVVVLRRPQAALLAMIPNIFPASSVFGGMGWGGILLEVGTISTASIAMGIAVDDTFHFLTWFRRGLRQGQDRLQSVSYAYEHCARAMIQTTALCGLGLVAFTFSGYLPTVRFAWLMIVLLLAALIGDLVLLPALLLGRFGRCFQRT